MMVDIENAAFPDRDVSTSMESDSSAEEHHIPAELVYSSESFVVDSIRPVPRRWSHSQCLCPEDQVDLVCVLLVFDPQTKLTPGKDKARCSFVVRDSSL